MKRYTVAVLVNNQFGVLEPCHQYVPPPPIQHQHSDRQRNRNRGVFPDHRASSTDEETAKQQLVNQLYKLPDVCSIKEFNENNSISCELLLIKMQNDPQSRSDIRDAAEAFHAVTVDYSKDYIMLRLTDSSRRIDEFINLMRDYTILEICRTGSVSLEKSSTTIRQAVNF